MIFSNKSWEFSSKSKHLFDLRGAVIYNYNFCFFFLKENVPSSTSLSFVFMTPDVSHIYFIDRFILSGYIHGHMMSTMLLWKMYKRYLVWAKIQTFKVDICSFPGKRGDTYRYCFSSYWFILLRSFNQKDICMVVRTSLNLVFHEVSF